MNHGGAYSCMSKLTVNSTVNTELKDKTLRSNTLQKKNENKTLSNLHVKSQYLFFPCQPGTVGEFALIGFNYVAGIKCYRHASTVTVINIV